MQGGGDALCKHDDCFLVWFSGQREKNKGVCLCVCLCVCVCVCVCVCEGIESGMQAL